MNRTNKLILIACAIILSIISLFIVFDLFSSNSITDAIGTETADIENENNAGTYIIEPIEPVLEETVSVTTDDPRISVDENGGIHIDVGAKAVKSDITEPSIAGEVTVSSFSGSSDESAILMASRFLSTYTVTYSANGGSGAPSSQTKTEGEDLQISYQTPTRSGYSFEGWSLSSSSSHVYYTPGEYYTEDADLDLYAVWKSSAKTYKVNYYANGGSGAPSSQTKIEGVGLQLSMTAPTRSGYTFEGWSLSSSSAHVSYTPGEYYTSNASINLYAVWEPVTPTYRITYYANGGSGAPGYQTKAYGVDIKLSMTTPTRSGYSFEGWSLSSSSAHVYYTPGEYYSDDADLDLYAVWEYIPKTYKVNYYANGGSGAPSSQTKTEGISLKLSMTAPIRNGYTFEGWSTSSSSAHVYYTPGEYYYDNADLNLYAVWEYALKTYRVTYYANGGSNAPSSQTKVENADLKLSMSVPSRSEYTFRGWSLSSSSAHVYYTPGEYYSDNADLDLYAVWEYIPKTYTVSYNANGGYGAPSNQTKTENVTLTLSSVRPMKSGYSFLGWSTSATASSAGYQPGGSYTANESVTLYAVWSRIPETYTVSYNANGGSGAPGYQTKTEDVALTLSHTRPTRAGYAFLGWSASSNAVNATYQPGSTYTANSSITLYAVWDKVTYNYSVLSLAATPSEIYKNGNTRVSFYLTSACAEAKSGVPVEVYFDGILVYSSNLDFSSNETDHVSFDLNVGSAVGEKLLTARINWSDRTNETNSADNSASATVIVKEYIETSASAITLNGKHVAGTNVISSFFAENSGDEDILPNDNIDFIFEVYEINGSQETLILSQRKEKIVVPAKGSNLIYFKWSIPDSGAGETYRLKGIMNVDGKENEVNPDNNTSSVIIHIENKNTSQTADTRFEANAPSSYLPGIPAPDNSTAPLTWNEWEYDSSADALVLYEFGVMLSNAPEIAPDEECGSATRSGNVWKMKSGYGITISWVPTLSTPSGCIPAKADAVTGVQLAEAYFPEFNYSTADGYFRTLDKDGDNFEFTENHNSANGSRVHFIPIYVKNGGYTVSCKASQIWTPAGMMTVTLNSNAIVIDGTIYDDWAKE